MDFAHLAHLRGARLADLAEHVTDVLHPGLAPEDAYDPDEQPLASYTFTAYALSGLAAALTQPTGTQVRASSTVSVPIADDAGGSDAASRSVVVYGPGDVLGLDVRQVVRRYPTPGAVDAEIVAHPHIEFDRTELPWAFSAQAPGPTMRPWIALVVLEEQEVTWLPPAQGLHRLITVRDELLPPPAELHRWAHAQTVGATEGGPSLAARLSTAFGAVNVSRLLAARVLRQDTSYVACVVPTTDVGVRAAMGGTGGTLGPAWTGQGRTTVTLPVLDSWSFRTGPAGDFATLARRLDPVLAPWQVGRRTLDTGHAGDPLVIGPDDPGRRQVLRCALYAATPPPAGEVTDEAGWAPETVGALRAVLEEAATLAGTGPDDPTTVDDDLPVVGPRLYARGQRGAATLPSTGAGPDPDAPDLTDWFAQLNLVPAHRVVAGLGTRVVQQDAEQLMQAAWTQVGQIDDANRQLLQAQLARHLADSVHARFAGVEHGRLLQVTRPVAPRIRMPGSSLTLLAQEARSATPVSALASSFRRAVRPEGPLTRRLGAGEQRIAVGIVADGDVARDFRRDYQVPDGISGLSREALQTLDRRALAVAFGVDESAAFARVTRAAEGLAAAPSVATVVTRPGLWQEPDTAFDPGQALLAGLQEQLRVLATGTPAEDPVGARWVGGLAAGVAVAQSPRTQGLRAVALDISRVVVTEQVRPGTAGRGRGAGVDVSGLAVGGVRGAALVDRLGPAGQVGTVGRGAAAQVLRDQAAWQRQLIDKVPDRVSGPAGLDRFGHLVEHEIVQPQPGRTDQERIEGLVTPAGRQLQVLVDAAQKVTITDVRAGLEKVFDGAGALALPAVPERARLDVTRAELLARLDPARTVVEAIAARLHTELVPPDWFADSLVRPIMAAPRFDRPMFRALDAYDRDWLVPGLDQIGESDFVTVLSTNEEFTEAFLVGLSDEMGRELLWREYPTDQRGTYFHRFWCADRDELRSIHRFPRTRLGSHVSVGGVTTNRAVVLVKGEVVRRYPDLTVTALRAQTRTTGGIPVLPQRPVADDDAAPALFYAPLAPDILIAGLDISLDQLRQPHWWVVLSEHPQGTRFGYRPTESGATFARGSGTGADVAATRLDPPDRIAFEASVFLPPLR